MVKDLLTTPRLTALLKEFEAIKDGRIHKGIVGDEVTVQRYGSAWVIEIRGGEAKQRDIMRDNLIAAGIPQDAAEWIAAKCPVDLLPDRTVAEALSALESLGEQDDTYFQGWTASDRVSSSRGAYQVWATPRRNTSPFFSAPTKKSP